MTVFHDYTQLIRIRQRRITAAWHELANERVVVTPRVAREAAEGIIAWDLDRSIRRWQEDLQDPSPTVTDEQRMITRVKIWWATQWLQPSGVYELRVMNAQEQEHARRLVELIPRTGFTCHPSEVNRHPDTWIVCEALAAGGQMLITRNLGTTRRGVINGWVKNNQQSLGFRTDKLIISSDEWLKEKLGGLESEESSDSREARPGSVLAKRRKSRRERNRSANRRPCGTITTQPIRRVHVGSRSSADPGLAGNGKALDGRGTSATPAANARSRASTPEIPDGTRAGLTEDRRTTSDELRGATR